MKRQGIVLATAAALVLLAGCAPYYYDRYGYDGDGYYGGGYGYDGGYGRDGGSYGYRNRYQGQNVPGYGFDRRYRDDGRDYRGPYRDY